MDATVATGAAALMAIRVLLVGVLPHSVRVTAILAEYPTLLEFLNPAVTKLIYEGLHSLSLVSV